MSFRRMTVFLGGEEELFLVEEQSMQDSEGL